jgi:putative DNA primase/helicase
MKADARKVADAADAAAEGRLPADPFVNGERIIVDGEPLPLTDSGNAERLIRLHGDDLRFCPLMRKWFAWDGARWRLDNLAQVERWAKEAVRSISAEAARAEDSKPLLRHALRSESGKARREVVSLASAEEGIAVLPEQLDADPLLLNVINGTLDLRTLKLREHRRSDLITKIAPVEFTPEAECPRWEAFLRTVTKGDPTLMAFLQRAAGYAITGDIGAHVLFFLHGAGRNGKGTFVNTLLGMLGDYAVKVPTEILLARKGERHPTTLTLLHGRRFAICNEANEGRKFDLAVLKDLTGGDQITAHRMREDDWSFWPTHKLFLTANSKPRVPENNAAVWERMMLVPFEVEIPRAERDPTLLAKLKAEWPGILAWAIRGLAAWREAGEGRNGLGVPARVEMATESYRVEEDVIGAFVEERCLLLPTAKVPKPELYKEFSRWSEQNAEATLSKHDFNGRVAQLPGVDGSDKLRTGKARLWHGIGLRAAPMQTETEARA